MKKDIYLNNISELFNCNSWHGQKFIDNSKDNLYVTGQNGNSASYRLSNIFDQLDTLKNENKLFTINYIFETRFLNEILGWHGYSKNLTIDLKSLIESKDYNLLYTEKMDYNSKMLSVEKLDIKKFNELSEKFMLKDKIEKFIPELMKGKNKRQPKWLKKGDKIKIENVLNLKGIESSDNFEKSVSNILEFTDFDKNKTEIKNINRFNINYRDKGLQKGSENKARFLRLILGPELFKTKVLNKIENSEVKIEVQKLFNTEIFSSLGE